MCPPLHFHSTSFEAVFRFLLLLGLQSSDIWLGVTYLFVTSFLGVWAGCGGTLMFN
jgi:hypothetical protein